MDGGAERRNRSAIKIFPTNPLHSSREGLYYSHEAEELTSANEEKKMRKLLDLLGDVMLMLCAIAGISVMELVFVYLVVELSK